MAQTDDVPLIIAQICVFRTNSNTQIHPFAIDKHTYCVQIDIQQGLSDENVYNTYSNDSSCRINGFAVR